MGFIWSDSFGLINFYVFISIWMEQTDNRGQWKSSALASRTFEFWNSVSYSIQQPIKLIYLIQTLYFWILSIVVLLLETPAR
jgi:hypothetical protein